MSLVNIYNNYMDFKVITLILVKKVQLSPRMCNKRSAKSTKVVEVNLGTKKKILGFSLES